MAQVTEDTSLEVRRLIRAPRARVFEAWTRPEDVKRWSAPGPLTTTVAEVDLRVGGKFRIHIAGPGGEDYRAVGEYREVTPPARLVYTWSWEAGESVKDSLVTVEFHDRNGDTEVVLRHSGLPDAATRESHVEGWTSCLEKLVEVA